MTQSPCASSRIGGKVIHVVLDNYGSHKHPEVMAWLVRHPPWTFHFTPTSN
jgi:hypothetical protein